MSTTNDMKHELRIAEVEVATVSKLQEFHRSMKIHPVLRLASRPARNKGVNIWQHTAAQQLKTDS